MFDTSLRTLQSDFTNNFLFLRYLRTSLTSKKILNKIFVKNFTPCQKILTWWTLFRKKYEIFDENFVFKIFLDVNDVLRYLKNKKFICKVTFESSE